MKAYVPVSSLGDYSFCPRSVYLSEVLDMEQEPRVKKARELFNHSVRRELSLRRHKVLGRISSADEIEGAFLEEAEEVLKTACRVFKDIPGEDLKEYVSALRPQLKKEMKVAAGKLHYMVDEVGMKKALEKITPWKVDYSVCSDELRLTGRIDAVMKEKNVCYPVDLKTGEAAAGVWDDDKAVVCAYSMLLEENLGIKVPYGYVEYTRTQERMPVMNTEELRENVMETRDEILEILGGNVPEICPHGNGKKCEACGFSEKCYEI